MASSGGLPRQARTLHELPVRVGGSPSLSFLPPDGSGYGVLPSLPPSYKGNKTVVIYCKEGEGRQRDSLPSPHQYTVTLHHFFPCHVSKSAPVHVQFNYWPACLFSLLCQWRDETDSCCARYGSQLSYAYRQALPRTPVPPIAVCAVRIIRISLGNF